MQAGPFPVLRRWMIDFKHAYDIGNIVSAVGKRIEPSPQHDVLGDAVLQGLRQFVLHVPTAPHRETPTVQKEGVSKFWGRLLGDLGVYPV